MASVRRPQAIRVRTLAKAATSCLERGDTYGAPPILKWNALHDAYQPRRPRGGSFRMRLQVGSGTFIVVLVRNCPSSTRAWRSRSGPVHQSSVVFSNLFDGNGGAPLRAGFCLSRACAARRSS